jgi:coenzyme F420-0:L-glutamate ligase/coenzyme F420-1:gamma-L-glutamate ligase
LREVSLIGVELPEVRRGDDLASLICSSARLQERDVVAVASKVVSKAKGYLVDISSVRPTERSLRVASALGMDPRWVELVLSQSDEVLGVLPVKELYDTGTLRLEDVAYDAEAARMALERFPYLFIVRRSGMIWTDAGIDASNVPGGLYAVPPPDPDAEARELSSNIASRCGVRVAVVLCDTEVSIAGASMDRAIGSYGIRPVDRGFGKPDRNGVPKYGGVDHIANEVCASAALLARQTSESIPVVLVRGLSYEWYEGGLRDFSMKRPVEALRAVIRATLRAMGPEALEKLVGGLL